jgi:leader peptidase (prepilin peptidase)/N-methyltransferase
VLDTQRHFFLGLGLTTITVNLSPTGDAGLDLVAEHVFGDAGFKQLIVLNCWMGWQMLPLIVLLSSVVGAMVGVILLGTGQLKKDKPMPFGPFITAAGWIALIWGEQIINFYTQTGGFG